MQITAREVRFVFDGGVDERRAVEVSAALDWAGRSVNLAGIYSDGDCGPDLEDCRFAVDGVVMSLDAAGDTLQHLSSTPVAEELSRLARAAAVEYHQQRLAQYDSLPVVAAAPRAAAPAFVPLED
jgi:hypothetical protein